MSGTWETSFVAMTMLVGGSVDDASCALSTEGEARAAGLLGRLRDPQRAVRAAALADAAARIVVATSEVAVR